MKLGEVISKYRSAQKLSMEAFAKKAQISKGYVSMIEHGINPQTKKKIAPTLDVMNKLAAAMNITLDSLVGLLDPDERITTSDAGMPFQTDISAIFNRLTEQRQQRVYDFASDQLRQQSADENELSDNVVDFPEERNVITGRSTAAGDPIDGDTQDADAVSTVVKIEDIPHGTDEIVTVDGDSMQPDFMRGDQIYIHWQPTIDSGDLAIVRVRDEGVTFKQIMLDKRGQKIVLHSINPDYPDRRLDCDEVEVIGKVLG